MGPSGSCQRFRIFEHIAPLRRAGHTLATARPWFAPGEIRDAADVLASFEPWERLRTAHKLSRARTARVVEAGLLRLLG